jgi:hypothetical protein
MPIRMVLVLLGLFSVFLSSACLRNGSIELSSSSLPPSFDIRGRQDLDWIWFQGPYKNRIENGPEPPSHSDPKKVILWQINPPKFIPLDQVPLLTYGKPPPGWEQQIPLGGSQPEPLREGYVYYVQAVTPRGPDLIMCIASKMGRSIRTRKSARRGPALRNKTKVWRLVILRSSML